VAFLPAMTMGMAASTLAGQNIGARAYGRVQETFRWAVLLSGGIAATITVVALLVPGVLLRAFTTDPEVLAIGAAYLRIVSFTYILYAIMFASNGIINGAGHTLATTVTSVIALLFVRVPLAGFLAATLGTVTGIWYAMLASVGVGMLLSLGYYFSGRWRRPVVRTIPAAACGDEG
jgi:Na+-driven multidrug efflux pump